MIRNTLLATALTCAFTSAASAAWTVQHPELGTNIVARETTEAPRGRDHERPGDRQRRGGKAFDDSFQMAREGTEGPRGGDNERPGDRQRRGGKAFDDSFQMAREGTEGPRGGDNERPGDRQRRGGRLTDGPIVNT